MKKYRFKVFTFFDNQYRAKFEGRVFITLCYRHSPFHPWQRISKVKGRKIWCSYRLFERQKYEGKLFGIPLNTLKDGVKGMRKDK